MGSPPREYRHLISSRGFLAFLTCILMAGLLGMASTQTASAQSASSCQQVIEYIDLGADGRPEAMLLACQFASGTDDQLTIYKESGEVFTDIPWQENVTYENEIWLFDHGRKGKASLIVHFRRDRTSLVAELYDDRDQDGKVGYEINNGEVVITENPYWTVQVVAPDGWWVRGGELNYNLHISVDGDVEGMFGMDVYREYLVTDGQPDYEIQIYDQNRNGKPEFDKRMILTDFLQWAVGLQTQMMANWADNELPISEGFDLWPYLDLAHEWEHGSRVVKGYHSSPAPILFEPATGRIEAIAEFVASRGGEHNCFYYSGIDWLPGQVNPSDNENPFCFYDLARDGDGIPELQIRSVYWPPKDPAFLGGRISHPYGLIRYSWDQENSGTWRYAIGLVGRHAMEGTVAFADVTVLTVPYSELPRWVTGRAWDMAVFSEFTGSSYFTSEGNYSVSYPENQSFAEYFTGLTSVAPSPVYMPEADFRMEWAMDYGSRPYLYFSPIDHRLHLLGATGGTWNVNGRVSIRYADRSGDGYIDEWLYLEADRARKQLRVLPDYLVYADNRITMLKQASVSPASFQTTPPADSEEWLELGRRLERYHVDLAPVDLASMLQQFEGPGIEIQGATIRDLRETSEGFRFILELQPGFRTVSDPEGWASSLTAAGEYAVSFDGAAWDARPATPAAPRATELVVGRPDRPLRALEWTTMEVLLENNGLQDASDLAVGAILTGPAGEREVLTATVTLLPGKGSQGVAWDWVPSTAGAWQVCVQVGEESEPGSEVHCQPLPRAGLYVEPRPIPRPGWFLSLASSMPGVIPVFIVATALLVGGAGALWAASRQLGGGR
mgnify:CR=1 FL=1